MSNLLILARGGLGDLILAIPAASALKAAFPQERVTFLAQKNFAPILKNHPDIDEIIEVESGLLDSLPGLLNLAAKLKQEKFNRAFLLWAKAPEAWLTFLSGIPVRVGDGSRLGYSFLFTHKVKIRSQQGDEESHWSEIMLDFIRALGIEPVFKKPQIFSTPEEKARAEELLQSHKLDAKTLIGFHPGKGVLFSPENISYKHLAEQADQLAQIPGAKLIFTGSPKEKPLVRAIIGAMNYPAVDLCGLTNLRELAALLSNFQVLVCPDSGPMHLASALGVKVAAIFALKSDFPKRWAPLAEKSKILRPEKWQCKKACRKENCDFYSCYQEISPSQLRQAVEGLFYE